MARIYHTHRAPVALKPHPSATASSRTGSRCWGRGRGHKTALTQEAVDAAVEAAAGNVTAAASLLGVSRGKLLRLRKRAKKE
jgi:transcriptional regulator of acetoin/glycerol metabolism